MSLHPVSVVYEIELTREQIMALLALDEIPQGIQARLSLALQSGGIPVADSNPWPPRS